MKTFPKRKQRAAAALAALALLGLCACAGPGRAAREAEPEPVPDRLPEPFPAEETDRMINLISGNRALVAENALYCFDYDEDYRPVLARYELGREGLGERTVLAEDCLPTYLSLLKDRLYYVNNRDLECVGTDGTGRQTLRRGPVDFLQLDGGWLYFLDGKGRFCRAGLDGGGERVVLRERCCYPFLSRGMVLYQSEEDGERLHAFWLEDGLDVPLSREAAYAPAAIGERLYYTGTGGLVSTDLEGLDRREKPVKGLQGAAELIPEGEGYRLRWTVDRNGLRQYTAAPEDMEKSRSASWEGYRLCDFAGNGWRVDAWYDSDGRLRSFFLVSPDGTETEYLGGQILTPSDGPEIDGQKLEKTA